MWCVFTQRKIFLLKIIGWLLKLRCNSILIHEELLELSGIHFIAVVQSWKSTTLKIMNGIKTYTSP